MGSFLWIGVLSLSAGNRRDQCGTALRFCLALLKDFTVGEKVLHEFAHQLDYEDFQTDGAPALATRAEYLTWARVVSREFAALQSAGETGTSTVLDTYGATNPAEFFAVVTEAFFERPRALRGRHPELYAQLARFFRQDPSRYSAEATTTP